MASQADIFKKMAEECESLNRLFQPPAISPASYPPTSPPPPGTLAQDYASQAFASTYLQQGMYDPYSYSGFPYYPQDNLPQQDQRSFDNYGNASNDGYYQGRGGGDYDRERYRDKKSFKKFDDRERKQSNNQSPSFGGTNGGNAAGQAGQGGFHIAGTKIFVNNIEPNINDADITRMFGVYGKINDLKVFHRPDQNYAYIIYDRYEDAFTASNQPSPNPNWSISLAKSKNTVMQYQQSTMFTQSPGGAPPPPLPFKNSQKFYPGGGTVDQYKKPYSKSGEFTKQFGRDESGKYPLESHLSNILNNYKDPSQLMDLMLQPPERLESLATNKTQINQTILVREIWISSINSRCAENIKDLMEEQFGPVEDIEFFPRGDQSFVFVKFYMVQTAHMAFSNKDKIADLLEANTLKLTYSDPSRRRGIIGDHREYMKDENLSPVLFVSFPFGFKISKQVIIKIASDYGTVLNVTVKRSEDPKQTSSVLIEFQDLSQTKFAFSHLREDHDRMNPRCEFAILLNSDKFIKENNVKLKEKQKEGSVAPQRYIGKRPFSGYRASYDNPFSRENHSGGRQYQDRERHQRYDNESEQHEKKYEEIPEQNQDMDEQEQKYIDDDEDEYIWSGFISLKSKGRCGMDAKVITQSGNLDFENHNLIMNQKCPIEEAIKTAPYAVIVLKPSNQTQAKPFKDTKAFVDMTPKEAGVVVAKNFTIYLLPIGEEASKLYPDAREHNIVAICHTPESLKGQKTKKDVKIEQKNLGKNIVSQDYDLSNIVSLNKEEGQEDEEEDLYDPSQITSAGKNKEKEADLSELIDNPNLVDTMMKDNTFQYK